MKFIKNKIKYFWGIEGIRFLIIGGINSLIGIFIYNFIYYIFVNINFNVNDFFDANLLAYIAGFIVGIPIAYTTQSLFAFRAKLSLNKFLKYPIASLSNLIIQTSIFIIFTKFIFQKDEVITNNIAYVLAILITTPIIYFIVKKIINPKKT